MKGQVFEHFHVPPLLYTRPKSYLFQVVFLAVSKVYLKFNKKSYLISEATPYKNESYNYFVSKCPFLKNIDVKEDF